MMGNTERYSVSLRWFKNAEGWCQQQILTYSDGYSQREYIEWGLSDQEYFKRKLAGTV